MRDGGKGLIVVTALFCLALTAAWVLYGQLESMAEGTWAGFRLGGAGAGFMAVFLLLRSTYERTLGKNVVKVQLRFPEDDVPGGVGDGARCTFTLFNRDSLERSVEHPAELLKEGAGLVFYLESQSAHDLIQVTLDGSDGTRWMSGHHPLHVAPIEMKTDGE